MAGRQHSHRNTIAMTIAWWYLRRLIRKRGTAAVAGLVAGQGLSLARPPRRRHRLRGLFVLGIVVGAGIYWWRRQQGGGDDWGGWEPATPVSPAPAEPAPSPEPDPVPQPLAT